MGADVLAMQGGSASTTMILTTLHQEDSVPPHVKSYLFINWIIVFKNIATYSKVVHIYM